MRLQLTTEHYMLQYVFGEDPCSFMLKTPQFQQNKNKSTYCSPWQVCHAEWVTITLLVIGLLTACTRASSSTSNPQLSDSSARRSESMTLTLWHSWSGAKLDALNRVARDYEQAHPSVRIRLQSQPASEIMRLYSTNVADGSAPQLLLLPGRYIGELAERQYIMPLDQQALSLNRLLPAAVESVQIDQQTFAAPLTFDTVVLFYDRRYMPAPPNTFDELLVANQTQRYISDNQPVSNLGYYLSLEQTLPYLSAFGGRLIDANGTPTFATADRNATIEWLTWLQSLQTNPQVLASPDYSTVNAAIQGGRVLAVIDWAYRRTEYAQMWGAEAVGIAPLPALGTEAQPRTVLLPEVICINMVTSPAQRTAAQAFLRYLIGHDAQTTFMEQSRGYLLPVRTDVTIDDGMAPIQAAVQQAQPLSGQITKANMWRPLNEMLRSVLLNAAPVPDAVDAAGTAVDQPER
jgi:arabinogalactan oligomer/maltooligosaccharide transport system substrate-binding protein